MGCEQAETISDFSVIDNCPFLVENEILKPNAAFSGYARHIEFCCRKFLSRWYQNFPYVLDNNIVTFRNIAYHQNMVISRNMYRLLQIGQTDCRHCDSSRKREVFITWGPIHGDSNQQFIRSAFEETQNRRKSGCNKRFVDFTLHDCNLDTQVTKIPVSSVEVFPKFVGVESVDLKRIFIWNVGTHSLLFRFRTAFWRRFLVQSMPFSCPTIRRFRLALRRLIIERRRPFQFESFCQFLHIHDFPRFSRNF